MIELTNFFSLLEKSYLNICPTARKVNELLKIRNEKIVNDHIAFRTFNIKKIGLESLSTLFIEKGYEIKGNYNFDEKKLNAYHLEYSGVESFPKIFISELLLESFHPAVKLIAEEVVDQIKGRISLEDFLKEKQWIFNKEAIHSKSDNSPLVGEEMIGKVIVTINKGYITTTP